ncbi:MAG TPA: A24 family peptidase [Planctomycetaceae bacterium]|jgi:Flp pilus assembly protein protease CpaA|nr:A24 family peptidase [Planctomycetaceae bacterium]
MNAAEDARGRRFAWSAAVCAPLLVIALWVALNGAGQRQSVLAAAATSVLVLVLAASCVTDFLWHKIPNWATYTAVGWALTLNLAASLMRPEHAPTPPTGGSPATLASLPGFAFSMIEPSGLPQSLLGMGACFGIMLLAYQFAGSGAGDVKLAAAVGALLGVERGLSVLIVCHLTAGAVILCWVIWTTGPVTVTKVFCRQLGALLFPGRVSPPAAFHRELLSRPVPLAAFFAIGTCITLWKGVL